MKMVLAIVNNDDSHTLLAELSKNGFGATKLSTSGGFLRAGNSTLLIGVEDEKLDEVIDILREFCSERTETTALLAPHLAQGVFAPPVSITVGGATVFVLDVEKFLRL